MLHIFFENFFMPTRLLTKMFLKRKIYGVKLLRQKWKIGLVNS